MMQVFVDTIVIISLFDKRDSHHMEAKELLEIIKEKKIRLITSDYVFDESVTIAMSHVGHDVAVRLGELIFSSRVIRLVWLNESSKKRAWDYFKRHSDKKYSFTDCTSFVLMKEKGIHYYCAFDEHFNKAGFINFIHGSL